MRRSRLRQGVFVLLLVAGIGLAVEFVDRALAPPSSSGPTTADAPTEEGPGAMLRGTGEGMPAANAPESRTSHPAPAPESDDPAEGAWRGTLTVLGADDKPLPGHRLQVAWHERVKATQGAGWRTHTTRSEYRTDEDGVVRYAAPPDASQGHVVAQSSWSGRLGDDARGTILISPARPDRVLRYAPQDVLQVTVKLPNGEPAINTPVHFRLDRDVLQRQRDARDGAELQPMVLQRGGTLFSPEMRTRAAREGAPRAWSETRFGSTDRHGREQQEVPRVPGSLLILVPPDREGASQTHRGARARIQLGKGAPELVVLEIEPIEDVEGIVVDAQGRPVPDVLVLGWPDTLKDATPYGDVKPLDGDGPPAGLVLDLMTRTDERGRFKMRLRHRGPHRFLADPDRHEGLGPSRPVLLEEDKPLRLVCASEGTVRFRVAEGSMGGTPVLIQAHGLLRKGVKTTVGADNTFQAHLVDGAEYTVWIMASGETGPLEADRRFYARHRIHASTRREHVIPLRPLRALSGRLRHEGIESVFPITAKLGPWTWSARANQRGEFSFPALPREPITLKHTVLLNSVSGEVVTSLEGEVRGVGFLNYEVVAQPDATYVDLPEESGER